MKIRIKGNSLRLRITPSEMELLMERGRIEETIHFATDEDARLSYALEHSGNVAGMSVRSSPREIAIVLSSSDARRWAETCDVGLYAEVNTSHGALDLAVEKDFACLDKGDPENDDTFPNPKQQGRIC